ncbi:MAG: hypothetical protein COA81_12785 [Alphaproteobacteria bacterium]|nr:MAG: hypothetical protein COA81_12785 [Alphaproteobacteria bacterium]
MEFLNTYFGLTTDYLAVLGINLVITVLVLGGIRYVIGWISNINTKEELAERDNPALGISLAGVVFAVGIVMTGVISGEASADLGQEAMTVALSGVIGIALIFAARMIFDKVSMPKLNVRDAIVSGNVAVSVMDMGNVIATALIIKAVFLNTEAGSLNLILAGVGSFIVSQLLLSLASYYRIFLFNKYHGTSLQDNVSGGNIALALRFSGFRIGMAFAISGALALAPLDLNNLVASMGIWLGVGLVQMVLVVLFSFICEKLLLMGVDTRDEVDNQKNVAVGATQAALLVAISLIIFTLVS